LIIKKIIDLQNFETESILDLAEKSKIVSIRTRKEDDKNIKNMKYWPLLYNEYRITKTLKPNEIIVVIVSTKEDYDHVKGETVALMIDEFHGDSHNNDTDIKEPLSSHDSAFLLVDKDNEDNDDKDSDDEYSDIQLNENKNNDQIMIQVDNNDKLNICKFLTKFSFGIYDDWYHEEEIRLGTFELNHHIISKEDLKIIKEEIKKEFKNLNWNKLIDNAKQKKQQNHLHIPLKDIIIIKLYTDYSDISAVVRRLFRAEKKRKKIKKLINFRCF